MYVINNTHCIISKEGHPQMQPPLGSYKSNCHLISFIFNLTFMCAKLVEEGFFCIVKENSNRMYSNCLLDVYLNSFWFLNRFQLYSTKGN